MIRALPLRAPLILPIHGRGGKIGLYGGSFNPPHAGHLLVAERARKRLGLQHIWWLVTPGNPLKSAADLAPLSARMAACRALIGPNPFHRVIAPEAILGTRYSVEIIRQILRQSQGTRFVWILGADSFAGLHRWQAWRTLAAALPMVIVDRPGATLKLSACPAGQALARYRRGETRLVGLATARPPAWNVLYGPRCALSSTGLRQLGG